MVFFSKNKQTALARVKKLSATDKRYAGKSVVLAKQQVPHVSKWKTWKTK